MRKINAVKGHHEAWSVVQTFSIRSPIIIVPDDCSEDDDPMTGYLPRSSSSSSVSYYSTKLLLSATQMQLFSLLRRSPQLSPAHQHKAKTTPEHRSAVSGENSITFSLRV